MGLLTTGKPLNWKETEPHRDSIKEQGIVQFVSLYHKLKSRQGDQLKWGDEIEYMIVKFDHENRKVRLSCRAEVLLDSLQASEQVNQLVGSENRFLYRPEYASYMVEGTPGVPYGALLACFNLVESNMIQRAKFVENLLEENESIFSIGNFPLLGCPDFTVPSYQIDGNNPTSVAKSLFFPDEAIFSGHPRFRNLTRNIRQRRGEKVAINVPIFRDLNTPDPFIEDLSKFGCEESVKAAKANHIYMDAMGFGMGCCCLQVTFQAVNVSEARWLYDQLTPLTPVLLALSASTPIFRGFLADIDSRWDVISASVDDRTAEERGVLPLEKEKFVISKSRYDTTDCYLYPCSECYNDIDLQMEEKHYEMLRNGGVDDQLAKHIAHLFIRDPLQVYADRIEQDSSTSSENFETIQSSNWCNMRFKPPPLDQASSIGWRVEFRPTEVQLTAFENAAYCCFVVLLTRVIISYRLSFLIPISKVNENMKRAQRRDAVLKGLFYFRRGFAVCHSPPEEKKFENLDPPPAPPPDDTVEMTIDQILNGKGDEFPGLIPIIKQYLDSADVDVETRCVVSRYLGFVQKRARGEICTLAHFMRDFVTNHVEYNRDSVVSESICYDLMCKLDKIQRGLEECPKLLGDYKISGGDGRQIPQAVLKAEANMTIKKLQLEKQAPITSKNE